MFLLIINCTFSCTLCGKDKLVSIELMTVRHTVAYQQNYKIVFILFSASEKRAFLLYYAIPLLSRYLPSDHLFFLMLLTGGIFRLLKQSISQEELHEAHTYLKLFTAQAPVFYGKNCTIIYQDSYFCLSHSQPFCRFFIIAARTHLNAAHGKLMSEIHAVKLFSSRQAVPNLQRTSAVAPSGSC